MCVLIFILCHFEFLGVQKVGIHITLLLTFKVHRGEGNVGVGVGVSHPRVKAVKLESPTSVGSHLVSWRLRNVRPGKGWHSKLKGAGSGQPAACVDGIWSEGREGEREAGECVRVAVHTCVFCGSSCRQLLRNCRLYLSSPTMTRPGANTQELRDKGGCRKGDLGRRSRKLELGGRRMPPSDFCGTL